MPFRVRKNPHPFLDKRIRNPHPIPSCIDSPTRLAQSDWVLNRGDLNPYRPSSDEWTEYADAFNTLNESTTP